MNKSFDSLANTTAIQDALFGPGFRGQQQQFDFTLLFESIVLSILPAAAFLIYMPRRAWWLWGEQMKASWSHLVVGKQVLYLFLFIAQVCMLAFIATSGGDTALKPVLAAQSLAVPVVLGLSALSLLEHTRSPRSSDTINVFLFFSTMFDAVQVRTFWIRPLPTAVAVTASICLSLRIILLLAEAQSKSTSLYEEYKNLAPETLSGVYARRVFWWLNGLMRKGYKITFDPMELMAIDEEFGSRGLLHAIEHSLPKKSTKHGTLRSLLVALRYEVGFLIAPRAAMLVLSYTQPFLFQAIINHLDIPRSKRDPNKGYGLIAATGLLYLFLVIIKTYYQHKTYQLVTKVRGCLVSLLYSKTLQSAPSTLSNRAPVTLMSVDVDGVTSAVPLYNEIWASAAEIGIAAWLLERQLGVVWIVPFGVAFLSSGLAVFLSRRMGPRQARWNEATQERLSSTTAVLDCIKSIKMMGFSKYVIEDIKTLRDKEIVAFKGFRRYTVFLNFIANLPFYAAPALTFTVFAFLGEGEFTISKAFTSLSLINLLESSTVGFIASLPQISAALGCLGRIDKFLSARSTRAQGPNRAKLSTEAKLVDDGKTAKNPTAEQTTACVRRTEELVFSFRKAALRTAENTSSFQLNDVNIDIYAGSLVGISGPAGCGKTTIIKALLDRLPCVSGTRLLRPNQSIAYCAQTPWLPSGTIKDVIIGDSVVDEKWYDRVLKICALDEDLKVLDAKDATEIGSQGGNLSGGQRQRIALARGLFSKRKIFILDDVLSGLDARTSTHICRSLFGANGVLRELGATVVIATNSAYALSFMDTVLSNTVDGRFIYREPLRGIIPEEPAHPSQSTTIKDTSILTSKEKKRLESNVESIENPEEAANTFRQAGDWNLYKHYINSVGWWRFGLLATAHLASAWLDNFPTVWLKQWSSAAQDPTQPNRTPLYLGVYGAVALLGLASLVFGIWFIYMILVPTAGKNLHDTLLETVVHASQHFHDITATGTTLNRFAQDMQHIDRDIPSATLRSMHATADCLAAFVLLSISASYMAAFIPILLITLYYLQKFYLRTSRQLRLLDIESRAPLYTAFQETSDGLDTITAFGWHTQWTDKFLASLDASQKPYYLLFSIQRWLILILGIIVAIMSTILVTIATEIKGVSNAGSIGIGLIALLTFNDRLNLLVVEWTTLETSLGAIARLKAFTSDTPVEDSDECGETGSWPTDGEVEYRNVSARYRDDLPWVLDNISFKITARSTCAIIGRTGSGKSSLVSALMCLLPLSSGSVVIDDVPHTSVPLQHLRSQVACIPQQPYILAGSVRRSLDPGSNLSDANLCAALKRVKLWDVFTSKVRSGSEKAVLDESISPETLSLGQTQLLVLARTLLRHPRPRILVLDEVTSSLDEFNDGLLQQCIREDFIQKGCTVIAVTHRVKGIMDFDQVVVLGAGKIQEIGNPNTLVKHHNGEFSKICAEQGIFG